MSSSKNIYKLRDFATGVYKSIKTGDKFSHVGIFDQALWTVAPLTFTLVLSTPLSCVNKYMYVYSV